MRYGSAFNPPIRKQAATTLIKKQADGTSATAWLGQMRSDLEWLKETFLPNYRERMQIPILNRSPSAVQIAVKHLSPIEHGSAFAPKPAKKHLKKRNISPQLQHIDWELAADMEIENERWNIVDEKRLEEAIKNT